MVESFSIQMHFMIETFTVRWSAKRIVSLAHICFQQRKFFSRDHIAINYAPVMPDSKMKTHEA